MRSAFGVDHPDQVSKGRYTDDVERSLKHRRKATRRLTGAEAAEAMGVAGITGALVAPDWTEKTAASGINRVLRTPYVKAQSKRGFAEMEGKTHEALKWGARERKLVTTANRMKNPYVVGGALLGAGLGTGLALRAAGANQNRKSNKIARQYNKENKGASRIAIVGLGSKTRY